MSLYFPVTCNPSRVVTLPYIRVRVYISGFRVQNLWLDVYDSGPSVWHLGVKRLAPAITSPHRGTLPIKECFLLGPYSRATCMRRSLRWF